MYCCGNSRTIQMSYSQTPNPVRPAVSVFIEATREPEWGGGGGPPRAPHKKHPKPKYKILIFLEKNIYS